MPPSAVRTEGLTKSYRSGDEILTVFQDLNLQVEQGERVALVGASGAGKSSLLHCLGGLDRPSSGRIYFGQDDIQALSETGLADFRNRRIGFVWQTHYLLPEFTAQENVMMPLLIRGDRYEDAAPVALARLDEVGLRSRAHHRSGELSGGEQQRVVLARALVGGPDYLFADEPTGNLDEKTGDRVAALIKELHQTHKLTSIFVTHDREFAKACDRVLQLHHGGLADITARI
ncbi:MAG: ABC transporter ATP-binding protein [Acidobacteria bacterium]|nr:ABC transporter ATP-binding protein [Acidobacteriota bacterium]